MTDSCDVIIDGVIYQIQSHGGIARLYREILPRMCNIDGFLQIHMLTSAKLKQGLPTHPRISHISLRYLWPKRLLRPVVEGLLFKGEGSCLWHSTYYTMPAFWKGKQVVTVVDMIYERFEDLFNGQGDDLLRKRKRRCIEKADAVICVSKTTSDELRSIYEICDDRIHVIPLACNSIFRRVRQHEYCYVAPTHHSFLLYVGMRTHHKNFGTLLKGYSLWPSKKDIDLVVVGKPWSVAEERELTELGVQHKVHLLPTVDDDGLCELYNRAQALVLPSLYEGFGLPLLEAMACGCPIVASRIPTTLEVAGNCPIYFEPTDVDNLLTAFDLALSGGRDSERVRVGLDQARYYSWEKTARQTLDVYRSLISVKK